MKKPRFKNKTTKITLNPIEYKMIRASAKAHKEILQYFKEHNIKVTIENALEDSRHSKYLTPRCNTIEAAREIAINKKYEIIKGSIAIHQRRTSDAGSRTTQHRGRKNAEAKREEHIFIYPKGVEWTDKLRDSYRTIFKIHHNSGMSEEQAQELTLQELGL